MSWDRSFDDWRLCAWGWGADFGTESCGRRREHRHCCGRDRRSSRRERFDDRVDRFDRFSRFGFGGGCTSCWDMGTNF